MELPQAQVSSLCGFLCHDLGLVCYIIPLPSLELDSQNSAQCLAVKLYISFRQLLAEGSMMTIRVVTNLITGEEWLRGSHHYC